VSPTPDSTSAGPEQTIADLRRERDEALAREAALAEVLQVINSSPGDLAPVFDAILEKARRLCGAEFGTLMVRDGALVRALAAHGVPEAFAEILKWGAEPGPGNPAARLIGGEPLLHISDLAVFAAQIPEDSIARAAVKLGGVRTVLFVPLRKDDAILGFIAAYRQQVRAFSERQIALLQNFAAQAVIAMENARLLTETREALEQQTATAEVLQVINSSPGDLAPVFDAMLDRAMHLCEASFGIMFIIDGQRARIVAERDLPEAFSKFLASQPPDITPDTFFGRAVLRRSVLHTVDVRTAESYLSGQPLAVTAADIAGVRALLMAPLLKDEGILGVFAIFRTEVRPFTERQIALLQNFAAQAVIAMENARLLTETREALEQQTATAEVLQVINSSPADLAPVFRAILETAHRLCGSALGSLVTFDGTLFTRVASHGYPEHMAEALQVPYPPQLRHEALLRGERFVQIIDLRESGIGPNEPVSRDVTDALGLRTGLYVPLRKNGRLVGLISSYRQQVRPFSDGHIALLESFAAQAVIAMENARLLSELRERTDQVAELNRGLEARVAEQVEELGRVGRLKRFLAPQLAELIVSQGDEKILESHRREIVVVFCDLRGYTAFTETAEPEEVLKFLREYHGALGPLVSQFEGTLDQFSGDGIMVFFNDPVPCPDPAERAVKMAMAMREEAGKLIAAWRRHGCELGFGAGIAQGYATLGQIGFSERSGYTAIGTVCNLAARLCAEAKDGQILVSSHIAEAVEAVARLEDLGNLELKGLRRPVAAFNVVQSTSAADARPNLTVVASGPGA
jgi:class 3 adenylate cyclase